MAQRKPSRRKRSRARPGKPRKAAAGNVDAVSTPASWVDRVGSFPLLILIILTSLAYINAWPDNRVLDDVTFAVAERYLALNLSDVVGFFSQDLWAADGANSGLYRPLLLVSIMIDAYLFGDWYAGYHLVNILLHVLTTLAVYGLIRQLLLGGGTEASPATLAALLGALIFGVHPIHAEAVNSIFNRSEILVTLGAAAGLWWFLRVVHTHHWKAWIGISLVYLVILFCRETAAVYPGLIVIVLWLSSPGSWLERTRKCLPVVLLLIPLAVYLGLRAQALERPEVVQTPATTQESVEVVPENQPAQLESAGLVEEVAGEFFGFKMNRLLFAFNLWEDALVLTVWPHPLLMYHEFPAGNPWIALTVQLSLLAAALFAYFRKRPELLIGLLFFYLAFLPASRIFAVVGLLPTLTERSVYFPSVGLAIALSGSLVWLSVKFDRRYVAIVVLAMVTVLTPVTWARNAEWVTDISLDEADYRRGHQSGRVLLALVTDHLAVGNYRRSVEICDLHPRTTPESWSYMIVCGDAYYLAGRLDEAEKAYLDAIWDHRGEGKVRYQLALMYLRLGRRSDAKLQFEQAIEVEDAPFLKEFRAAMMLIKLYPSSRPRLLQARTHLQNAIRLQPQSFQARQMLEQLDDTLGS